MAKPALGSDAPSPRERLLEVALDFFSSRGFEGTGLRELAAAAGVNHSLVLYHFGSLEGLWKAIVSALFDDFDRRVRERLAGLHGLDPVTRLKVVIEGFIRFSFDKPELHRLLTLEGRRKTERLTWLVETYLKPRYREILEVIRRGQAEGRIRAFDPALVYYAVVSLGATPSAFAPEIEAVTGRRMRNDDTVAELAAMLATLIFTDPPAATAPPAAKRRKRTK